MAHSMVLVGPDWPFYTTKTGLTLEVSKKVQHAQGMRKWHTVLWRLCAGSSVPRVITSTLSTTYVLERFTFRC